MGEETIEKVLKNFGLTDTEAEVYIFLAKHGVLKSREIARQMKKDRAQSLRILKSLQSKGLVEGTLEVPMRYAAVSFEEVIDSRIKAKRDEAALIESTKTELLSYWKKISKTPLEPSLEKFVVIEGERTIYPKIAQMIRETKNQFLSVSTTADLARGIQFGLFEEMVIHSLKSKAQFRFITEVSKQNIGSVKSLLERILKTEVNIKGRNPELGLSLFPRMMIRDSEEIVFFIKPRTATETLDLCLWTNCTDLVRAFTVVFEDLWRNSIDIKTKIREVETGTKTTPKTYIINDAETAHKKYDETVNSAEKEITVITSSQGLLEIWKNKQLLNDWIHKGISVKIMAPIISENMDIVQQLSTQYEIRHIPGGYLATTIIDGKHLFQFKSSASEQETHESKPNFENAFYTNDSEHVTKTKNMLNDVWRNALTPSAITLESALKPPAPEIVSPSEKKSGWSRPDSAYQKMVHTVVETQGTVTEKDVLNKIINAKKYPVNWPKEPIIFYGSSGTVAIHPPKSFNLPDMMIWVHHYNKQSSFGALDFLVVYLWRETPRGYIYVPVVRVIDDAQNPNGLDFGNAVFAGTPAGQNVQTVKKDELQIRIHGNTLFAGWTVPIKLFPASYVLPPSCILLEGYGKLHTGVVDYAYPSGVKTHVELNGYDSFVTFFHPA
ncbi:MAG: helix-turn-helix domain-containing protein, partial [Candidatus Bathyarchaeia archaeon]